MSCSAAVTKKTKNGREYIGHMKNGQPHGQGTRKYKSGKYKQYVGGWKDGSRQGKGKMMYSEEGKVYEGEYNMGVKTIGTLSSGGYVYKGSFDAGHHHGWGEYKYPSGDVYSGHWVRGIRSGHGAYRWSGGSHVYNGTWTDDKRTGMCVSSSAESGAASWKQK